MYLFLVAYSFVMARYSADQVASILQAAESDNEYDDLASDSDMEMEDDVVEECSGELSDERSDESCNENEAAASGEGILARDKITLWKRHAPSASKFRLRSTLNIASGPTIATKYMTSESEIFCYLFDETCINHIVHCTNVRLAAEANDLRLAHDSIAEDVTIDELYSYIGILIMQGVLKKRAVDVHEIWSEEPGAIHRVDWIVCTMSRERFKILCRYITFDNIETREERCQNDPKLFKFREVLNNVKNKIVTSYEASAHTCVDENLYPFRGRCPFRQYMPMKPAKYGFKVWQLVDSESIYLIDFNIYLGKEGNEVAKDLGGTVVKVLAKSIEQTGRNITTDNYFTSLALAKNLWDKGLTLVGTIRKQQKGVVRSNIAKQKP